MNENPNNNGNLNQSNINQIPIQQVPPQNNMPYQNNNQAYGGQYVNYNSGNPTPNKDSKGLVSIVLGGISIILAFVLAFVDLPIAVIGLILGISSKGKEKVIGIILNVIGIILSFVVTVISILLLFAGLGSLTSSYDYQNNVYTFYGKGFNILYGGKWTEVIEDDEEETKGLMYGDEELYFIPVGKSSLSDLETQLSCDANTPACKEKIYDNFYDYWDNNSGQNHLYDGSENFTILKGDIYYATMNYGTSENSIKGKMYLLISKNNNVILSFISKTNNSSEDDDKILDLLKNITVYEYFDDTYYGDDDDQGIGDKLNDLSNWNRYADLRKGNISHNKTIYGGWRILSDSEVYWVFKNNEFWWYKSVNDLNDNYWYGTTEIITGKEGLKKTGISEDKIDTIIKQSNGKVTESDVYTVICTPKQLISNNQDNSSVGIPADLAWTYIWIIVDHGTEGIEAQVLNMQEYENSYYVKIND